MGVDLAAIRRSDSLLIVSPDTPVGGAVVLSLSGELDRSNEMQARQAIERALRCVPLRLILDLSGLEFMDSSGVNVVLWAHNKLVGRRGNLQLVVAPGPVRRLLELVHLVPLLPTYSSVGQALADRDARGPANGMGLREPGGD